MEEEEIEDLDKFLKFQFILGMQIVFNVEYIKRHIEEKNSSSQNILKADYLNYIGRLASDDIILSVYKLLNSGQNYSFNSLVKKINHLKSTGFQFKSEIHFDKFKNTLKELNKLYIEEKINDVRNKYVGHLDINREKLPFNIEKIILITEKIFQALNDINLAFREEEIYVDYDKNKLAELIDDNILLNKYLQSEE